MTCGVYQIINLNNGRCYVGSSINIEERWRNHVGCLRRGKHHAPKLQAAFNRDGEESFRIVVVDEASIDDLNDVEQRWIDLTKAYGYGYNGRPTADKHGLLPEITKQRMSIGSKRAGQDPELRRQRSERAKQQHANGTLGRHTWSDEARAGISAKLKAAHQRRKSNSKA